MKFFNSLFFKTAAILSIIFGALAFFLTQTSLKTSEEYHNEITQGLNKDVSKYIVDEVQGLYDGETVVKERVGDLMHHVMATNPSTEVYLLDLQGNIIKHVAMDKVVKAEKVDLSPVKEFIAADGKAYIKGDDPREIGGKKIFSAAPYMHDGEQVGYIYTIVGGQDYDALVAANQASYVRKLREKTILTTLLTAFLIGLLAFWLLTRNLNKITNTLSAFKKGELNARVQGVKGGEMGLVANTFNDMAGTIQGNIEDLKSVDNLRKELIANISHDLRTPIASIQGFVETLMIKGDTISETDKTRYMEIVMQNTDKLKKLVDDLFELSKLEAKQRELKPEALQMAELIQDTADKYRIIAQKKGISINTIYSKNLPMVEADLALIDRALQNIIDNAIKFCKDGDVINLELSQHDDKVRIKIADTGTGIAAKELPFIFERYRKGKFLTDTQKGSGLGLAIVKKIMELHKTDISVESVMEKGTAFFFDLPMYGKANFA